MELNKNVFTTGEVAKICNVAPRTVSKWFDAGHLRGYRIPGSKDRRIPVEQLVGFMRSHGIPLNGLDTGTVRILLMDTDAALCVAIRDVLTANKQYEVSVAGCALDAGALAIEAAPRVILADVSIRDFEPKGLVRFVRSTKVLHSTCLIGTACGLTEAQGQGLLQDGFDSFLSKPFETRSLISLIEQHTRPEYSSGSV